MDPTQWGVPFPLAVVALFAIVMLRANGSDPALEAFLAQYGSETGGQAS